MTTFIGGRPVTSVLEEQPWDKPPPVQRHWCEDLDDLAAAGWLRRLAYSERLWAANLVSWWERAQFEEGVRQEVFDHYWRQRTALPR